MANNINTNRVKSPPNGFTVGSLHNGLCDIVQSLAICDSKDIQIQRTPSGTTLKVIFPPSSNIVQNAPYIHDYTVYDASTGSLYQFSVTPGNHLDTSTNTTWVPMLNGWYINAPDPWQTLEIDPSYTYTYFKINVNPLDASGAVPAGAITAIEIDAGTSIPSGTNTIVYQLCANISCSVDAVTGNAKVTSLEGGVSTSQVYQVCNGNALFGRQ